MNHGIEKAISGLNKCAEQYKKQHLIKIFKDRIVVNLNDNQLWGTMFYLMLIILTPILILLYYFYPNKNYQNIPKNYN